MIYASVCSGVEAASLAWIPLGWKAAWFSEIEPFPCAVLKHRFPEVPNLGDMTKIKVETIENETGKLQRFKNESGADVVVPGGVDLLVGGTPCQGFSVAGKQDGLDDPRSALCLAYCELLETMRPKWFVWENVPGVFSTNQGDDFRAFLRKIDEIGYSVAWRVLDAQYVRVDGYPRAVPQRRRRVFVVGHLGDWRYPASVLFEPGCLPGSTPPRRVKGEGVARSLTASTGGASGKEQQHTFISGDGRPLNAIEVIATGHANAETVTDICVTLTCNHEAPIVCGYETGQGYWQSGDIAGTLREEGENRPSRPSSNIICAGFSGGQGAKAGGIGYEDEVAPTIKGAESGSNQVPNVICYENHAQDSRIKLCGEYSPQINAKSGTGGCNLPLVQECFPINSMIIGENVKVGDRQIAGIGNNGDPLPTILSSHHHAVAVVENIIGRKENNGGNGIGVQVELAYTQNATGVMGVCYTTQGENQNADAEKARAVKILRLLRDEIGEKAFCEWTLGRLGSFQAEKVLQPNLHGESVRREAGEEKIRLDDSALSCAKNNAKNALRCLWEQFQLGHPSQGQELAQQFTAELNLRLSQLPHEIASVATVRRLLPIETERLMGFPEVDILEIGKMTKDEFIAWELASGNITVDFSTGKVFSCRTGGGTPCPPHELEGTILSRYKVVSLREKEVKKQCRVHRILWIAAHGIIPDGYVIDHINNDKLDNRLCNLQLLRPEENSTKAAKDGLYLTGEDHPKTKLTDEQKNDIITLYETEYYSVRRLAAMYGVSKSRIHQLVKRQGWTQIPWKGKTADECPDSPRYKACGNSMCVNVMRWIGIRIELTERKLK